MKRGRDSEKEIWRQRENKGERERVREGDR